MYTYILAFIQRNLAFGHLLVIFFWRCLSLVILVLSMYVYYFDSASFVKFFFFALVVSSRMSLNIIYFETKKIQCKQPNFQTILILLTDEQTNIFATSSQQISRGTANIGLSNKQYYLVIRRYFLQSFQYFLIDSLVRADFIKSCLQINSIFPPKISVSKKFEVG